VVFLAVTAEERGLLGSTYYAQNPLFPLATTAGVINMDGPFNPGGPTRDFTISGSAKLGLLDMLVAEGKARGLRYTPEAHPEAGGFFRSDHFPSPRWACPPCPTNRAGSGKGRPARGEALLQGLVANRHHQPADGSADWDYLARRRRWAWSMPWGANWPMAGLTAMGRGQRLPRSVPPARMPANNIAITGDCRAAQAQQSLLYACCFALTPLPRKASIPSAEAGLACIGTPHRAGTLADGGAGFGGDQQRGQVGMLRTQAGHQPVLLGIQPEIGQHGIHMVLAQHRAGCVAILGAMRAVAHRGQQRCGGLHRQRIIIQHQNIQRIGLAAGLATHRGFHRDLRQGGGHAGHRGQIEAETAAPAGVGRHLDPRAQQPRDAAESASSSPSPSASTVPRRVNSTKTASSLSGSMPTPVSTTSIRNSSRAEGSWPARRQRTPTSTPPSGV
jgi:hypothetical protein